MMRRALDFLRALVRRERKPPPCFRPHKVGYSEREIEERRLAHAAAPIISLSQRDWDAIQLALKQPPQELPALRDAAVDYRRAIESGELVVL